MTMTWGANEMLEVVARFEGMVGSWLMGYLGAYWEPGQPGLWQ